MGHYSDYYDQEREDNERRARDRELKEVETNIAKLSIELDSQELNFLNILLKDFKKVKSTFAWLRYIIKKA